ncbi:serine/threonine-protein kinase [Chondromyces crocatus]|uniref:serine/threonine-protein kinase n=1 Tax=Chondromyces crocatus TaxID=52 RepID=UPI00067A89DC|nr:serine/threonine-protein kinase [Chondromyces crocatus]
MADALDWSPSVDPLIGTIVGGRYEVLSLLGEGGMGTVYEVRHATLGRTLAMKVLRRDIAKDPDLVARFTQEAKAAAGIGHPNIVTVMDFGSIDAGSKDVSRPFFVMELLEGRSLGALLRAEKLVTPARVAPLFIQCARALEAAHKAGVVHRDLKPDNLFIVRKGDAEVVKLLDFGVAKVAGNRRLTRVGMVFGTPHYMSPEQAEGKHVDARTDVYALGVIMYECFSGRVPFEADTYMGVLTKHMFAVPEPLERVAPDAAALGSFGPLVMRCLAKRVEERFPSMAELADALELALTNPKEAAAGSGGERPRRPAMRLRDSNPMLGPVQLPREVDAPPSSKSRSTWVALGVAAVVLPVAALLGVRALQGTVENPETALGASGSRTSEASASLLEPTAAPSTSAAQNVVPSVPTAVGAVSAEVSAVSGVAPRSGGSNVSTLTGQGQGAGRGTPATTAKPRESGDLVDPWRNTK